MDSRPPRPPVELSPEMRKHRHQVYLSDLTQRCRNVVELVEEYFKPPNGMTWTDPDNGWKVTIERLRECRAEATE